MNQLYLPNIYLAYYSSLNGFNIQEQAHDSLQTASLNVDAPPFFPKQQQNALRSELGLNSMNEVVRIYRNPKVIPQFISCQQGQVELSQIQEKSVVSHLSPVNDTLGLNSYTFTYTNSLLSQGMIDDLKSQFLDQKLSHDCILTENVQLCIKSSDQIQSQQSLYQTPKNDINENSSDLIFNSQEILDILTNQVPVKIQNQIKCLESGINVDSVGKQQIKEEIAVNKAKKKKQKKSQIFNQPYGLRQEIATIPERRFLTNLEKKISRLSKHE
ncbi:UNKNOWN [Stylonychia lemnae]|uniref:Uncharacterized protein n=1 Tax=Stylonychia lemnae TaxID=5949 RepID=A0A078ARU6_STYLE|nr:UNKNOWN [Stylonychia lemnae]|eukprot:CDW83603.1 UNKNOWN [Stylonychia lemnae]